MIIFYIKMKIRAGGGALGQQGGALGQQGAPPAIPLYGKHYTVSRLAGVTALCP